MITKKDYDNIARIIGHYNLSEDFVGEIMRFLEHNNPRFSKAKFKLIIKKTRDKIFEEFQNRDDRYKKENELTKLRQCPQCGKQYRGFPALSRRDNKTDICSDCGTIEGFEDFLARFK